MKKILTLFLILIPLTSFSQSTGKNEVQEICGVQPSLIPRLFTDLEKIRIKCVNDYYDRLEKQRIEEIAQLLEVHAKMKDELAKTAFKVNLTIVNCHHPDDRGLPPRPKAKRCSEIVEAQNAILRRVDLLNGWVPKKETTTSAVKNKELNLPCPSQKELNDMQMVRSFNKRVHEIWTNCTLNQM